MFSEEIKKYPWKETTGKIYKKTAGDVERALSKNYLDVEDLMALLSPAAEPYLGTMAKMSRKYTQQRFGKVVSMYIPLYMTNVCNNFCVYCSFNHDNKINRVVLTDSQILDEMKAIKRMGDFQNLLLLTGEDRNSADIDYIERAVKMGKELFSNISIEVMPLKADEYKRLADAGLNGVVCFQETYNSERYKIYHPKGMKSKYEWRVNGFDRMGQANVHKIGLGVLVGLEDWRTDITMMAHHLRYLQKNYWETKYSINFPRLRPAKSGFQPNYEMSDKQLAQCIFAFRIFDHDVDISVSTRERPLFRDKMIPLGVTSVSAGSMTDPGGYYTYPVESVSTEQFHVSDERKPEEVVKAIKAQNYEVVWKDWDMSLQK